MPGSTKRNKREEYMHAYGGKVSSPAGRSIVGASHVPAITKGVYHVGGTVTGRMSYNQNPQPWVARHVVVHPTGKTTINIQGTDFAETELRIAQQMFGDSMCGDCIRVKLRKEHDDIHRVCQLCGTVWQGIEPGNRRREAVEATHAARAKARRVG